MMLLFSPNRLKTDFLIFESYHKIISGGIPGYTSHPLTTSELRHSFSKLSKDAYHRLLSFSKTTFQEDKEKIKAAYSVTNQVYRGHRKNNEATAQMSLLRLVFDNLNALRPFFKEFRWYHKLEKTKGHFLVEPCEFVVDRPQIKFELTLDNGLYTAHPIFIINEKALPSSGILLQEFLLHYEKRYYLLSWKDYQLLRWLNENQSLYQHDVDHFSQQVLSKLEIEYPVEKRVD